MAWAHSPNAEISVAMSDTRPILNRLSKLSEDMQKKDAKRAARVAMRLVQQAAQLNAAEFDRGWTPTSVKKNITVAWSPRQSRQQGGVVMRVGVMGGAAQYAHTKANVRKGRAGKTYATGGDKGNPGGDTWYWRFLEFGTSKMRAQPFLQRALADNVDAVTTVALGDLTKTLDRQFPPAPAAPSGGAR